MQSHLRAAAGISLADVLPYGRSYGEKVRFSACSSDWAHCQPGDLFVAIVGDEEDGHEFAREAVERGAVMVLAERPLALPVPVCVVEDTREAYGHVCQALAGHPAARLSVIGVTGTNGKTTTSLLIQSILHAAGRPSGSLTSLGYDDTVESEPAKRTTSQPEQAKWMAQMLANGCSHAVVELSSRELATRRPAGVKLQAAVLTNLRRDHLDFHGSLAN